MHAPDEKPSLNYLPHVDGLRAIAVLLVIAFHVFPDFVRGGFVGVDVFFVISGYLLSGVILRGLRTGSFSFKNFYIRRIKRIFPSLLVVLFASLIFGWFSLFSDEYASVGKHVMAAAFFVPNIVFWQEINYFAVSSIFKPLLHLWSLGVEEQFYVIWPIVLALLWRLKGKGRVLAGTLVLAVVSFSLNFHPSVDPGDAFYMPFMRFWEFIFGAVAAYLFLPEKEHPARRPGVVGDRYLPFVGILAIMAGVFFMKEDASNAWLMLLPVLGAACVIVSDGNNWFNRRVLSSKPIVFIGLISYPLYLWHWPLLSFMSIIESGPVSLLVRMVLVASSFFLAYLTYRFVERPIRSNGGKNIPLILMSLLVLAGACGSIVFSNKGFDFRFAEKEELLKSASSREPVRDDECRKRYQDKVKSTHCQQEGDGKKVVYIVGDSHTTAIFTGYGDFLVERGYKVVMLGEAGCSLVLSPQSIEKNASSTDDRKILKRCSKVISRIMNEVAAEKPYAVIFTNNAWTQHPYFYQRGMMNNFSLVPRGTKIIWFLQHPLQPKAYHLKCLNRPFSLGEDIEDCSYPMGNVLKQRKGYGKVVSSVLSHYPDVKTVDSVEAMCDGTKCPIRIGNVFLYDRFTHLSFDGSKVLAKGKPLDEYFPKVNR